MRVHSNLTLQKGFEFIVSMKTAPPEPTADSTLFFIETRCPQTENVVK